MLCIEAFSLIPLKYLQQALPVCSAGIGIIGGKVFSLFKIPSTQAGIGIFFILVRFLSKFPSYAQAEHIMVTVNPVVFLCDKCIVFGQRIQKFPPIALPPQISGLLRCKLISHSDEDEKFSMAQGKWFQQNLIYEGKDIRGLGKPGAILNIGFKI